MDFQSEHVTVTNRMIYLFQVFSDYEFEQVV